MKLIKNKNPFSDVSYLGVIAGGCKTNCTLTVYLAGLQVSGAALWRCARDVQLPCTTSRQLRDPYACQGKA